MGMCCGQTPPVGPGINVFMLDSDCVRRRPMCAGMSAYVTAYRVGHPLFYETEQDNFADVNETGGGIGHHNIAEPVQRFAFELNFTNLKNRFLVQKLINSRDFGIFSLYQ